jgi:hypothetical protein
MSEPKHQKADQRCASENFPQERPRGVVLRILIVGQHFNRPRSVYTMKSQQVCQVVLHHSRNRTKSSHANTQHIARVDIVSHQWLNGSRIQITKMTNNNNHHVGRFCEGGGSSPFVFAGICITEVAAALKKDAESQSITI